jgi:hypothetical protein
VKTVKLTAEEIRMLEIQMGANPCSAGCPLGHMPRLPKTSSGTYNCYAEKSNGDYICPLQRALWSIQEKLGLV